MAKSDEITFYDITVDVEDFDNDVMKLFNELRPNWKREDVKSKVCCSKGTPFKQNGHKATCLIVTWRIQNFP